MSFVTESISTGFGVDGVTIEQTLLNPYDPYSGMDIDINLPGFQNTNQGFTGSNDDGRIELGMFSFNDDNIASDNFPNVLGSPFIGITKKNMVDNGDCKFSEKAYYRENDIPVVVKPEGEWRFLSLQELTSSNVWDYWYIDGDNQGFKAYGGKYSYVPLSLEQGEGEYTGSTAAGMNYWGNASGIDLLEGQIGETDPDQEGGFDNPEQDIIPLSDVYIPTGSQEDVYQALNGSMDSLASFRDKFKIKYDNSQDVPQIAAWIITDEAYSNKKCLCFMNFRIWDGDEIVKYTNQQYAYENWAFNWLVKAYAQSEGVIDLGDGSGDVPPSEVNTENQYRVLNQVQKIYDKFNDEPINPYSSVKIRFKMKTTHVLPPHNDTLTQQEYYFFQNIPLYEGLGYAPKVEIGILQSQFEETPKAGVKGLPSLGWNEYFKAPGGWNSKRYYNASLFRDKNYSEIGGMERFQNSVMNEWETFEFTYNLNNEHNNRGKIYGVPYGGNFDDEFNSGSVAILINNRAFEGSGLPNDDSSQGGAEIYFKVPGYQDNPQEKFYMISPEYIEWDGTQNVTKGGNQVSFQHASLGSIGYMTVWSDMGEGGEGADNVRTGLQLDGRFIEAYLMYVGTVNPRLETDDTDSNLGYTEADVVVAYWDGERWSYDDNRGYDIDNEFTPNSDCFIIARLYSDGDEKGITGIDQYIDNEIEFPTDGIGNLSLFLQSGNNFNGRVLIDDIECFESYEFTPEVDVRKKKSIGNYGLADLTKYYDKEIEPEKYKDTTAPLEAQFYFYPQYPTDEIFVERTPIYQDFRMGRFYIYDIDWGDGTPNEFTSEPEQIDENTALYHTYETYGIFEVTATMIRVKTDSDDNIVGVAYNKKFKLRININEGNDEDFQYFGSDGYSFIPYKNTTPIIGGISKQSNYYKKTKRQLGFLDDEKISIEFKNKSDKLKTELALLKMENQSNSDLEVLPNYMIERFDNQGDKIYNGISPIKEELGKSIGDCDLTSIKYHNKPKSIWEMFGFENDDLNIIGNPIQPRYWKNIIPKDYSIFNREGLTNKLAVKMKASYNHADNQGPHYNLILNGVTISDGFLNTNEYQDFEFEILINSNLQFQKIRINFDNDGNDGDGQDRNIHVTSINIDGIDFDGNPSSHGDINVYYDAPSVYNYMENNPNQTTYNENGISSGGAMAWNGNMVFEIPTKYFTTTIDTYSEQDWLGQNEYGNTYYYPVLPRYGADGRFIEGDFPKPILYDSFLPQHLATLPFPQYKEEFDVDANGIVNSYDGSLWIREENGLFRPDIADLVVRLNVGVPPSSDYIYPDYVSDWINQNSIPSGNGSELPVTSFRNIDTKTPFSLEGSITDENESNSNILINIVNEKNDVEVFNDKSGNKNYGFSIGDFNPKFDEKTLRVKKNKSKSIFKTSKPNGAF